MKKYILLTIGIGALFMSCNMIAEKDAEKIARDPASKVVKEEFTPIIVALDYNQNQFAITMSKRTITDTMIWQTPSVQRDLGPTIDTLYEIPIQDTMRDQYGRPMIDVSGKVHMQTNWVKIDKNLLVTDLNKIVPIEPVKE